jgi:hypothetical protein
MWMAIVAEAGQILTLMPLDGTGQGLKLLR